MTRITSCWTARARRKHKVGAIYVALQLNSYPPTPHAIPPPNHCNLAMQLKSRTHFVIRFKPAVEHLICNFRMRLILCECVFGSNCTSIVDATAPCSTSELRVGHTFALIYNSLCTCWAKSLEEIVAAIVKGSRVECFFRVGGIQCEKSFAQLRVVEDTAALGRHILANIIQIFKSA